MLSRIAENTGSAFCTGLVTSILSNTFTNRDTKAKLLKAIRNGGNQSKNVLQSYLTSESIRKMKINNLFCKNKENFEKGYREPNIISNSIIKSCIFGNESFKSNFWEGIISGTSAWMMNKINNLK